MGQRSFNISWSVLRVVAPPSKKVENGCHMELAFYYRVRITLPRVYMKRVSQSNTELMGQFFTRGYDSTSKVR